MAKYGCGLSFGRVCMLEKEQIKHALKGELACGETDDGFVYAPAGKEECDRFILSAYDECVYQAKDAMDSGRALERLMKSRGVELDVTYTLEEYMRFFMEAAIEFNDYVYEPEEDDYDDDKE